MTELMIQVVVYLSAAVIAAPVARRLGLGSVLGYLIAGVIIGPVLSLAGEDMDSLQHVAEIGVVMMLFLIGLELDPKSLWRMRRQLGLGGAQVAITLVLAASAAMIAGVYWSAAVALGMVIALSSTAIVLQTLSEKGLMQTRAGRSTFAVLLFQDIAVIPMLALIPLLAMPDLTGMRVDDIAHGAEMVASGGHLAIEEAGHATVDPAHDDSHGGALVAGLPGWAAALATLGAIAFVVLAGVFLTRPVFRFIAESGLREIFTATALLLVMGAALLMNLVGLSPALGTFLAGVVLANSEFRHELEANIEPFKGLLLGLFFITVGAGLDVKMLLADAGFVVGLAVALIALKMAVLLGLARFFGLSGGEVWLFSLGLAQAGEFGFVLLAFSEQAGALTPELAGLTLLVVTVSMMLTPMLFLFYDVVIAPRALAGADSRDDDAIDSVAPVIIIGHGRFGQVINRMLLANGVKTVVLDHRASLIDGLRRFGVRVFYGDATRPSLLHAAGLDEAKLLIVGIDNPQNTLRIVERARSERPDLHIVARASDRQQVYALYNAGADDIIRELYDSSIRAGRSALEALGMHPYEAQRAADTYVRHDRETLIRLAEVWDPSISIFENEPYIRVATERNAQMEAAMRGDREALLGSSDKSWTPTQTQAEDDPAPPEDPAEALKRAEEAA